MNATKISRGFGMLDLLIALAIVAAIVPMFFTMVTKRQSEVKEQAVARHMKQFSDGAAYYVKENFTTLYSAAGAGTVAIQAATIRGAGNLPAGFQTTNGYGQNYCLLVRRSPSATPTKALLESFAVTEGGQTISPGRLPFVAAMIGASGAAVENVAGATTFRGAFGGFQLLAANYQTANCSGTTVNVGRLASALFFDNQNLLADYLYRFEVPGRPEANTMSTSINMGGNNITNANEVRATVLVDRTNPTFRVEPAGNSNINNLTVNSILAPRYCDRDDPTYCVDPAGTSRMGDIILTNRSTTVNVSSLLPNFVDKGSVALFNNQTLVKPICPDGGAPSIRLSPAVFQPDTSLLSSVFAIDAGGSWQVRMTSSGSVNMPPGAQVIAVYGCRYA
jgi:competence protein ComGC